MSTVVETSIDSMKALMDFGLLTPKGIEKAKAFEKLHSANGSPVRPRELLTHLVDQRLLTQFQADAVLRGAADRLIMNTYTLIDIIGSGSMGTVYKAKSSRDDGLYAIKTVPRKNVTNIRNVAEKVEALKDVRHPRVSALVNIGAKDDRVYMVWPFLEGGEKLDVMVKRQTRLPARQAAQIALQIASGLQAYHEFELFHGLLKPNDVVIGTDRRVRILDFGVGFLLTCERGKSLLSTTTNGKALAKGLDCASPETIVDPLARSIFSDQYSLGCILYFCLTGQYPFPDANPVRKMLGHQNEQPKSIRVLAPETPAKLVSIVDRLLAKMPEERYPTTDELVLELQAVTSGSVRGLMAPRTEPSAVEMPTADQLVPTPAPTPAPLLRPAARKTILKPATPVPQTIARPVAPAPVPPPKVERPAPKVVPQVEAESEHEFEVEAEKPVRRRKKNSGLTTVMLVLAGVAAGLAAGAAAWFLNRG